MRRNKVLIIICLFVGPKAFAQTLTEKLLRESPRLSWNMGLTYDSNLQSTSTYESQQGYLARLSPRYRINEKWTAISSLGVQQRTTQENRTDLTNLALAVSRNPFPLFGIGDARLTSTLILPTNEIQREKESLVAALRMGSNYFVRTNTPLILETGISATRNFHQFTFSAFNQQNIQSRITPYLTTGWGVGDHWQITATAGYDATWTYKNNYQGFFDFDQSLTYIKDRHISFTVGHSNFGSVTTLDGRNSNVAFFDTRSSVVYLNGTFNY